jgi:3-hydroxyacyl-[acyl-carrier-protein] dehydratase
MATVIALDQTVSPVQARVRLVSAQETGDPNPATVLAMATVRISPAEPVFAGHYPDFPIFPGVCLLECVRHAVQLAAPRFPADDRLFSVVSARFLTPVFPGDTVDIELVLTETDGALHCRATASTQRGVAAQVRLRCPATPAGTGER